MLIISTYDLIYYVTIYCIFILLILHYLYDDIFKIRSLKGLINSLVCTIIPLVNIVFLILLIVTLFIDKDD